MSDWVTTQCRKGQNPSDGSGRSQEVESNSLSIRTRASGELGTMPVTEVLEKMERAIANHDNFNDYNC